MMCCFLSLGALFQVADFADVHCVDSLGRHAIDFLLCNLEVAYATGLWRDFGANTCVALERRIVRRAEKRRLAEEAERERAQADAVRREAEKSEVAGAGRQGRNWSIVDGNIMFNSGGGGGGGGGAREREGGRGSWVHRSSEEKNDDDDDDDDSDDERGGRGGAENRGIQWGGIGDEEDGDQFYMEMDDGGGGLASEERVSRERKV